MIVFDPAKDEANVAKHGVSLALAAEMLIDEAIVVADDRRDYGEDRFRAYGRIGGDWHCFVFTLRGTDLRAISLRRARQKEIRRHAAQKQRP